MTWEAEILSINHVAKVETYTPKAYTFAVEAPLGAVELISDNGEAMARELKTKLVRTTRQWTKSPV